MVTVHMLKNKSYKKVVLMMILINGFLEQMTLKKICQPYFQQDCCNEDAYKRKIRPATSIIWTYANSKLWRGGMKICS